MKRTPDPESLDGRELADQVLADSERDEKGLRHGNMLVSVVGVVFVLLVATGAVLVNRVYPPPSPPNTATQEQLDDLRADLDEYLAGRGGLRDQQYARTVFTLCQLAADLGNGQVLADYDCQAVLAGPSPSVSPAPSVVTSPGLSSGAPASPSPTVESTAASTGAGARPPPTTSSSSPAPAPSSAVPTRTRPAPPTSTAPTPPLSAVLCNPPIPALCPGGTS